MNTEIDKKALSILFNTFWSRSGWRDRPLTSSSDLEYARRAGMMFDKVMLSHSTLVENAIAISAAIAQRSAANAFAASLSSRRLELRSALGSYAVLQHLLKHRLLLANDGYCSICGALPGTWYEDLDVLNFERFKWGGVRHDKLYYATFDLQQFKLLSIAKPTATDVKALKSVIKTIESVPDKTTSGQLEKHLSPLFNSNKAERNVVVQIFGYCGILETSQHRGYSTSFVQYKDRILPGRHWCDMNYPACWWKRSDGINHNAVNHWFGHLL
ncbi:MAG: hypothetical protein QM703_03090 [Gemmatales bacterium]